jgi:hypothetical protein
MPQPNPRSQSVSTTEQTNDPSMEFIDHKKNRRKTTEISGLKCGQMRTRVFGAQPTKSNESALG